MDISILLDPNYIVYFWLIISILFLFAELGTPGLFFFIGFAVGSAFAALVAFLNYSFTIQCISGLIVAIISFFVLRYLFVDKSMKSIKNGQFNTDALIGQEAVITKVIEPHKTGLVKVGSEVWTAQSDDNNILQVGTVAKVVAVQGNRVIVSINKN